MHASHVIKRDAPMDQVMSVARWQRHRREGDGSAWSTGGGWSAGEIVRMPRRD